MGRNVYVPLINVYYQNFLPSEYKKEISETIYQKTSLTSDFFDISYAKIYIYNFQDFGYNIIK